MNQPSLIPPSLDELIPEGHIVRVVNEAIDQIDIDKLIQKYKGGGTSSYHPRMMLKVLVYAYTQRIYTSRQIAKGLRENIQFMWISGRNTPDFRTINRFRGSRMKGVIEDVFGQVVQLLREIGLIRLENYFVDGTKIEADANKHRVVWAKRTAGYKSKLEQKIHELIEEIEAANEAEEEEYGDKDLEEMGNGGPINSELIRERMKEVNERLKQEPGNKELKAAEKKLKKDYLPRMEKYEEQEKTLAGRSSYAKADPDATCFRMKEDRGSEKPLPLPAYNVQCGTENQFIVGFSLHQRAGDTACFIPHMEHIQETLGTLPVRVVADAGYGSEENYAYLEKNQLENYVKHNLFHKETTRKYRNNPFVTGNLPYDPQTDSFHCPGQKQLTFLYTKKVKTDNGYLSQRRVYGCEDCSGCPFRPKCFKARGNRKITVNPQLDAYRAQANLNLRSEDGIRLRVQRNTDVEAVFGIIKHNRKFRRFHLRGLDKVKTEWGFVCIAHNLCKMAAR